MLHNLKTVDFKKVDFAAARMPPMTLVELLVGLTVVALLSAAVAVLLAGAGNTNQYLISETDALSQVENAYRRILHNVRAASAISAPASATPSTTLTLSTQPDPSYGNVAATVTYAITSGNLTETDSRYGNTPTVLVTGVTTFQVTRVSTSPLQFNVQIISGTSPPITRSVTVTAKFITVTDNSRQATGRTSTPAAD